MMRLPIFQLTYKLQNGKLGLVFPSELPYEVQEFGFFLPVPVWNFNLNIWPPYPDSLFDAFQYYFPVELDGKYLELDAASSVKDPFQVSINFSMKNQNVEFIFNPFRPVREYFRYAGNFRSSDFSQFVFYELDISSIATLNQLYNEQGGIFVGYTSNYGRFPEDLQLG